MSHESDLSGGSEPGTESSVLKRVGGTLSISSRNTYPKRETEREAPSGSELFSVIKNSRRRYVLTFLLTENRRVSLAELAVHIAAKENEISIGAVTSTQRKRVYVSLYQSHLPMLHEAGAVEYNDARKYAHPVENIEVFRPYLLPESTGYRWSLWYFTTGLIGVTIGLTSILGGGQFPLIENALLIALSLLFVAIASLHTYSTLSGGQAGDSTRRNYNTVRLHEHLE
ncbi:DUF7344 domain-containing protein [Halomarina rubra]|uniref:ArsR family transcriptional regulator n=1 Tax=Halomarina rubra TaxID=2071873 RepID=A0ABD6AZL0_9EURY|nr:hypothetical protein [Halomarina rubra]